MNPATKERLKGTLLVPVGLFLVLVPFALFIGWNLITLLVFWFAVVPLLTLYLPHVVFRSQRHVYESLGGLYIFYCATMLLIYGHYKSDFFELMMVSWLVNTFAVLAISTATKKHGEGIQVDGSFAAV